MIIAAKNNKRRRIAYSVPAQSVPGILRMAAAVCGLFGPGRTLSEEQANLIAESIAARRQRKAVSLKKSQSVTYA
jgi:hypothetical protein